MRCVCRLVAHVDTSAGHSRGPRGARLSPIPRRSRGQSRAARQPRHHVLALDSTTSCARLDGGPYARRHCMSTARVSAIPTPRSVTCRGRFRGRCSATGTSSSRCAYPTARPVAIRPLCDNNDSKKKGNGSPGHGCTWDLDHYEMGRHAEVGLIKHSRVATPTRRNPSTPAPHVNALHAKFGRTKPAAANLLRPPIARCY